MPNNFKFIFLSILIFLINISFSFTQSLDLGTVYTFLDKPVAEQRLVISAEEIQDSHEEDLCSLLQRKGIQILSYGPYGLESKPSIRGFTDETVRVVIDGVCVNNAQYGTFDFSSINLNQIERIEIVKGGFTEGISDEGAVAGAIYITTKKQDVEKSFSSDTSFKTYANISFPLDTVSQKLNFASPLGDNSFLKIALSGTSAKNEFYYKNRKKEFVLRKNSSVWDANASIDFTHFYGKGSSLTFSDWFYAGYKLCPGVEYSATHGIQQDYDNTLILSIKNPALTPSLKLESNFAWLKNLRFYDEADEHSTHDVETLKSAAYLTWYANKIVNESVGMTFDAVFLDSSNDGEHTQLSFTAKSTTKFFVNDLLSFTLPLAAKIQGENFAFVPKLGAKLNFDFGEFALSAYRMVQFPNMDDLYWGGMGATGNPDLVPEDGWGGEVTFNSHMKEIPFSLCVFTNYYQNKIQWASSGSLWRPENVASAFYLGLDVDANKEFFDGALTLKFNCEYLYTRLLDKNNTLTYGKRIMWTPDFVACLSADLNLDKWNFVLDASYTGKRYKSNINTTYLKPYVLMNAGAAYTGFAQVKPYVRMENILLWNYQAVDNYPMPIFSMTVGISTSARWQ